MSSTTDPGHVWLPKLDYSWFTHDAADAGCFQTLTEVKRTGKSRCLHVGTSPRQSHVVSHGFRVSQSKVGRVGHGVRLLGRRSFGSFSTRVWPLPVGTQRPSAAVPGSSQGPVLMKTASCSQTHHSLDFKVASRISLPSGRPVSLLLLLYQCQKIALSISNY